MLMMLMFVCFAVRMLFGPRFYRPFYRPLYRPLYRPFWGMWGMPYLHRRPPMYGPGPWL